MRFFLLTCLILAAAALSTATEVWDITTADNPCLKTKDKYYFGSHSRTINYVAHPTAKNGKSWRLPVFRTIQETGPYACQNACANDYRCVAWRQDKNVCYLQALEAKSADEKTVIASLPEAEGWGSMYARSGVRMNSMEHIKTNAAPAAEPHFVRSPMLCAEACFENKECAVWNARAITKANPAWKWTPRFELEEQPSVQILCETFKRDAPQGKELDARIVRGGDGEESTSGDFWGLSLPRPKHGKGDKLLSKWVAFTSEVQLKGEMQVLDATPDGKHCVYTLKAPVTECTRRTHQCKEKAGATGDSTTLSRCLAGSTVEESCMPGVKTGNPVQWLKHTADTTFTVRRLNTGEVLAKDVESKFDPKSEDNKAWRTFILNMGQAFSFKRHGKQGSEKHYELIDLDSHECTVGGLCSQHEKNQARFTAAQKASKSFNKYVVKEEYKEWKTTADLNKGDVRDYQLFQMIHTWNPPTLANRNKAGVYVFRADSKTFRLVSSDAPTSGKDNVAASKPDTLSAASFSYTIDMPGSPVFNSEMTRPVVYVSVLIADTAYDNELMHDFDSTRLLEEMVGKYPKFLDRPVPRSGFALPPLEEGGHNVRSTPLSVEVSGGNTDKLELLQLGTAFDKNKGKKSTDKKSTGKSTGSGKSTGKSTGSGKSTGNGVQKTSVQAPKKTTPAQTTGGKGRGTPPARTRSIPAPPPMKVSTRAPQKEQLLADTEVVQSALKGFSKKVGPDSAHMFVFSGVKLNEQGGKVLSKNYEHGMQFTIFGNTINVLNVKYAVNDKGDMTDFSIDVSGSDGGPSSGHKVAGNTLNLGENCAQSVWAKGIDSKNKKTLFRVPPTSNTALASGDMFSLTLLDPTGQTDALFTFSTTLMAGPVPVTVSLGLEGYVELFYSFDNCRLDVSGTAGMDGDLTAVASAGIGVQATKTLKLSAGVYGKINLLHGYFQVAAVIKAEQQKRNLAIGAMASLESGGGEIGVYAAVSVLQADVPLLSWDPLLSWRRQYCVGALMGLSKWESELGCDGSCFLVPRVRAVNYEGEPAGQNVKIEATVGIDDGSGAVGYPWTVTAYDANIDWPKLKLHRSLPTRFDSDDSFAKGLEAAFKAPGNGITSGSAADMVKDGVSYGMYKGVRQLQFACDSTFAVNNKVHVTARRSGLDKRQERTDILELEYDSAGSCFKPLHSRITSQVVVGQGFFNVDVDYALGGEAKWCAEPGSSPRAMMGNGLTDTCASTAKEYGAWKGAGKGAKATVPAATLGKPADLTQLAACAASTSCAYTKALVSGTQGGAKTWLAKVEKDEARRGAMMAALGRCGLLTLDLFAPAKADAKKPWLIAGGDKTARNFVEASTCRTLNALPVEDVAKLVKNQIVGWTRENEESAIVYALVCAVKKGDCARFNSIVDHKFIGGLAAVEKEIDAADLKARFAAMGARCNKKTLDTLSGRASRFFLEQFTALPLCDGVKSLKEADIGVLLSNMMMGGERSFALDVMRCVAEDACVGKKDARTDYKAVVAAIGSAGAKKGAAGGVEAGVKKVLKHLKHEKSAIQLQLLQCGAMELNQLDGTTSVDLLNSKQTRKAVNEMGDNALASLAQNMLRDYTLDKSEKALIALLESVSDTAEGGSCKRMDALIEGAGGVSAFDKNVQGSEWDVMKVVPYMQCGTSPFYKAPARKNEPANAEIRLSPDGAREWLRRASCKAKGSTDFGVVPRIEGASDDKLAKLFLTVFEEGLTGSGDVNAIIDAAECVGDARVRTIFKNKALAAKVASMGSVFLNKKTLQALLLKAGAISDKELKGWQADDTVAAMIDKSTCAELVAKKDQLGSFLSKLMDGVTGDRDERSILRVLECIEKEVKVKKDGCALMSKVLLDANVNRKSSLKTHTAKAANAGWYASLEKIDGAEAHEFLTYSFKCGVHTVSDLSDTGSRTFIKATPCGELKGMDDGVLADLLKQLYDGWTGSEDQEGIAKVLECVASADAKCSRLDAVAAKAAPSLAKLLDSVDGKNGQLLRVSLAKAKCPQVPDSTLTDNHARVWIETSECSDLLKLDDAKLYKLTSLMTSSKWTDGAEEAAVAKVVGCLADPCSPRLTALVNTAYGGEKKILSAIGNPSAMAIKVALVKCDLKKVDTMNDDEVVALVNEMESSLGDKTTWTPVRVHSMLRKLMSGYTNGNEEKAITTIVHKIDMSVLTEVLKMANTKVADIKDEVTSDQYALLVNSGRVPRK